VVYPRLSSPTYAVYATEYGAKFNDSIDDLAALGAAMDVLDTTWGGTLILPVGQATLSGQLNLDVVSTTNVPFKIIGQGMKASSFRWTGGAGTATTRIIAANNNFTDFTINSRNQANHLVMEDFGVDTGTSGYNFAGRCISTFGSNQYDISRLRFQGNGASGNPPVAGQWAIWDGNLDANHKMIRNCVIVNTGNGFRVGADWTTVMSNEVDQANETGITIVNSPYGPYVFHHQYFQSSGNAVYSNNNDTGTEGSNSRLQLRLPFLMAIVDEGDAQGSNGATSPLTGYAAKGETIYNNSGTGEEIFVLGCEQRSLTQPQPGKFGGAGRHRIHYIGFTGLDSSHGGSQLMPMFRFNALGGAKNVNFAATPTTYGTEGFAYDAGGAALTYTTAASSGSNGGIEYGTTSAPFVQRRWRPNLTVKWRNASAANTSVRMFVGLSSIPLSTLLASQVPVGEYVGFWYASDDATDAANYQFMSSDGTTIDKITCGTGTNGPKAIDTATYQWDLNLADSTGATGCKMMMSSKEGWTAYAIVKGKTNLPVNTTNLMFVAGIRTLTSAAKILNLYSAKLELM
jgi:hypothetical protein